MNNQVFILLIQEALPKATWTEEEKPSFRAFHGTVKDECFFVIAEFDGGADGAVTLLKYKLVVHLTQDLVQKALAAAKEFLK